MKIDLRTAGAANSNTLRVKPHTTVSGLVLVVLYDKKCISDRVCVVERE